MTRLSPPGNVQLGMARDSVNRFVPKHAKLFQVLSSWGVAHPWACEVTIVNGNAALYVNKIKLYFDAWLSKRLNHELQCTCWPVTKKVTYTTEKW